MIKIAFYKKTNNFFNKIISVWDNGPYSHCEILIENVHDDVYKCYSSSAMDGGVREKIMPIRTDSWDIFEYDSDPSIAIQWFAHNKGKKYDYLGLLGFLIRPIPGDKSRLFCSAACAAMIGIKDGWRFTPNSLSCICTELK